MRGATLAQLPVFLAVAERKSFSGAARALGVSAPAVSQAISKLEAELGTALLVRTTRSVNLTDAGARLVAQAGPAIGAAMEAMSGIAAKRSEPTGTLRLNVPRLAYRTSFGSLVAAYAAKYPDVKIDVVIDDRNVDIVAEGFDAGVRLHESLGKEMVALRLTPPFRFVVVGSSRYLAKRGRPKRPRDLVDHDCICWRSSSTGALYRWELEQNGQDVEVAVDGPVHSNDADALRDGAERHLGLAYLAEQEVADALASGRLEVVLEAYAPRVPGLFLYYPRAARRVPRLAAFVACAREATRAGALTS